MSPGSRRPLRPLPPGESIDDALDDPQTSTAKKAAAIRAAGKNAHADLAVRLVKARARAHRDAAAAMHATGIAEDLVVSAVAVTLNAAKKDGGKGGSAHEAANSIASSISAWSDAAARLDQARRAADYAVASAEEHAALARQWAAKGGRQQGRQGGARAQGQET